jgi:Circadian oscillating protein COP23
MTPIFRLISTAALAGSFAISLAPAPGLAQTPSPPAEPSSAPEAPAAEQARFVCQTNNGQPTVMYLPQSQQNQGYAWAVPEDMGSAWPAERRCQEISRRLEQYRPDGLVEMQTGLENGYNTVCVTTQQVPSCRIVFTVPTGQDPLVTRDRVFENLAMADRGESTQGVNTFTNGDSSILDQLGNVLNLPGAGGTSRPASGINLRPFLDAADGGTGTQLAPGAASGRPLNPDSFR